MTARITPEQLAAIDQLRAEGVPIRKIAVRVGVSVSTVSRRVRGSFGPCRLDTCTAEAVIDGGLCRRHQRRQERHGTPTCKRCGADEHRDGGLCGRCLDDEVAGRKVRREREREREQRTAGRDLADDDGDPPACPRGCGRPRHYRPAIACPPIGLPACPGGQAQEEVA